MQLNDIPIWNCFTSTLHVTLAETGIGMRRATQAAREIIRFTKPDIVISTGFCGALRTGLRRGDIVIAEKILAYPPALQSSSASLDRNLLDILSGAGKVNTNLGTFISTQVMMEKDRLAPLVDDQLQNPVLEMESHALAEVCAGNGIPFAAVRAVSDTAEYDPQPVCSKIFTDDMSVSLTKLLRAAVADPLIIRELLQLHSAARSAGNSLAEAIVSSLEKLQ